MRFKDRRRSVNIQGQLGRMFLLMGIVIVCQTASFAQKAPLYTIRYQQEATGRIAFGAKRIVAALKKAGYPTQLISFRQSLKKHQPGRRYIDIGIAGAPGIGQIIHEAQASAHLDTAKEGFTIQGAENGNVLIAGADGSGALYGCLELYERITRQVTKAGSASAALKDIDSLFRGIRFSDQPQMTLRGACIGLQKPYMLPGRGTYEYPYTRESFPWFYDKELWIRYLDMLVDNRMNTLYLWSGHPFASLVRLKDYPDAVEVDSATFAANQEMFHFLTTEANKRGIWVIQAFYNIIVSKPFAEKHHIKTQDRNRPITPLIADYTRKSIAAFVKQYPNVGLLVTLGEAMEGVGPDDTKWFTETIIPGVKDGLKAIGQKIQPPIILRAHDADGPAVMAAAKPIYSNLYTMAKYNGEALTTYQPRGPWAELHRKLSAASPVQIENVHILANLEPFRYGADDFIQKCVQAMHKIYGSNGLHLYPQASYWDWPYSADKADPRLLQINRDWIWYAEWARYAWNADRDRIAEENYWAGRLSEKYGCDLATGAQILRAYEASGEIAPKLLRRYGITDGNRQTLSLGMLMSQLIDPEKYNLFTLLYNSESPEGEMITEYAKREWLHQKHVGETPVQIAEEVLVHARQAVAAIQAAEKKIGRNSAEFNRLKNDMICYQHLAEFYSKKVMAALHILRYGYSHDVQDLESALPLLSSSVEAFRKLAAVAGPAYLYANSLQTGARKIPLTGKDGQNKTWSDLLPVYQQELDNFKKNIQALKLHGASRSDQKATVVTLKPAQVRFLNPPKSMDTGKDQKETLGTYYIEQDHNVSADMFSVGKKGCPFKDTLVQLDTVAGILQGLQGIQVDRARQIQAGTRLYFKTDKPVRLLVGFFTRKNKAYLKEPELETDASANDYGQAATTIANAGILRGFPGINVHSYSFREGVHDLQLGKGICLLLGFIQRAKDIPAFDAGLGATGSQPDLDWLFR
ncbi:alpha-d-galacturonidase [Arachidicoccus terrestris]|uniref:alpha-d-galacturonidase n=1 Tax=Arachidicoccus terrestris TaxID=2875539 RepID=UPI001CC41E72|nr:hypothetical protein [Arachidicoccus terrestris]UAY56205.1 hypothetical protein K9M52_04090 [Arachidicoccus terrestris]